MLSVFCIKFCLHCEQQSMWSVGKNSLANRLHNVLKMQKGFCFCWVRLGIRISNNHYLGVKTKVNAKSLPRYTVICPLSNRHPTNLLVCWLKKTCYVCIFCPKSPAGFTSACFDFSASLKCVCAWKKYWSPLWIACDFSSSYSSVE